MASPTKREVSSLRDSSERQSETTFPEEASSCLTSVVVVVVVAVVVSASPLFTDMVGGLEVGLLS